jgi:hypothetical protein
MVWCGVLWCEWRKKKREEGRREALTADKLSPDGASFYFTYKNIFPPRDFFVR